MNNTIYLLKIGDLDQSTCYDLKKNLDNEFNEFNINVEIHTNGIKLRKKDFDKNRKQFRATKLLKELVKEAKKNRFFRVLGILDNDIFSKNYNFIFGLAIRRSLACLISITRLRESFYIESSDIYRKVDSKEEFNRRILKEAKHELGHTFGLKHCNNVCVMQFSNSLMDTDRKPVEYCESCLIELNNFFS